MDPSLRSTRRARSMDLLRPGAHVVLVMVIPEYEDPMEDAGGYRRPRDQLQAGGEGLEEGNRRRASRTRSHRLGARNRGGGSSGSGRRNDGGSYCPSRQRDERRRAGDRLIQQGLVEPTLRRLGQRLRGPPRTVSSHADPPRPLSAGEHRVRATVASLQEPDCIQILRPVTPRIQPARESTADTNSPVENDHHPAFEQRVPYRGRKKRVRVNCDVLP